MDFNDRQNEILMSVIKELEKENADLKVKLKMAFEFLDDREQMLVNSNIVVNLIF